MLNILKKNSVFCLKIVFIFLIARSFWWSLLSSNCWTPGWVSQKFLTIRKFLSSGKEWPAACGNIYKSIQHSLMAWKQMVISATMKKNTQNISIWMCLLVKQMFTTETSIWVVRTRSNKVCIYWRIKYSSSL